MKIRFKPKLFLIDINIIAKKMKKTFLILSAFFAKKRAITLINILKKKNQKSSIGFGNFYISDYS